jgi:Protein of unknown function (DUF2723)
VRNSTTSTWLPALGAGLIALAVYVATASSNVGNWDIAENQTVPYILGIGHPTGFPAFTLAGWVFSHAFGFGTVAWRLNVFSSVWIAAATGGVALVARTLGAGAIEAGLGALAFAFGVEAWSQGVHADVHAMMLAAMIFALYFALRYAKFGTPRDAVISAGCCGLGLAVHPEAMFVLPALGLALIVRGLPARRTALLVLAGIILPLAIYGYFPLRSAYIAAHGLDPTAAPPTFGNGTIAWDTSHPRTLSGFIDEVTGRGFGTGTAFVRASDLRRLPSVAGRWLEYARKEMPPIVLVLAAAGLLGVALRTARLAAIAASVPAGVAIFSFAYVSLSVDLDRYLLPSFAVAAAFAAASAQLAPARIRRFAGPVVVALLAAAIVTSWHAERIDLAQRGEDRGNIAIEAVQRDIPDGALVIVPWHDATSLAYAAFIDHSLGSRTIVLGWPAQFADHFADWARVRRVFIYADIYAIAELSGRVPGAWILLVRTGSPAAVVEIRPPRAGSI